VNLRFQKKNRILLTSFLFIVLVVFAQIVWWIFFQISNSKTTSGISLKMAEKTRSVAAWHLHQVLVHSTELEQTDLFAGKIVLSGNKISQISGDTTGFYIVIKSGLNLGYPVEFSGLWMIRSGEKGEKILDHIHVGKLREWVQQNYPQVEIYGIALVERPWFLTPEDFRVSVDHVNKINSETERQLRMFIWEGGFFILLMMVAVALLYTNIRAEWIHSHQVHNFMLTVTHELKSPIASVKLYLETLLKHDPPKEKRIEFITKAVEETVRLEDHIENILSASRLESQTEKINFTELNLFELIENWFSTGKYQESGRIVLDDSLKKDVWMLGDEKKLRSVFTNLVDNALKYSEGQVFLRGSDENGKIKITVKDMGQGIPKSAQPFIFNKFFRVDDELIRNNKGVGLGLFIANECVKLHKGTILVESDTGKGSEFIVELPGINEA